MAASSLNLKNLSRLLHTSSLRPMAASSLNLKNVSRLLHTCALCPMTLRPSSRCFSTDAEKNFYEMFKVKREPEPTDEKPDLPPFVHHEFKALSRENGFQVLFYMAGVSKENAKVRFDGDEMIAEGKMEKEFDDVDDADLLIRYKMSSPPAEVFNLDGTKAEIKNGILHIFVPKKE